MNKIFKKEKKKSLEKRGGLIACRLWGQKEKTGDWGFKNSGGVIKSVMWIEGGGIWCMHRQWMGNTWKV